MSVEPQTLESPEAVLSTLERDGRRRWMHPVRTPGPSYWRRLIVGWTLIVLFVALPWIPIGGKPAVLLDLAAREFTFFGMTLYPTDTLLLMLGLLTVFAGIVWATALLGRVWCGWACPQTVYMEFVFRPIEELFEGKANARRRRDREGLTSANTARKFGKWTAFTIFATAIAHTFLAYFVGWDRLLGWITGPPAEHWGSFVLMGSTSALMLFDFGWFREQMCTIVCPYARLQSVLQDRDSLIVSYDPSRGEPRGRRSGTANRVDAATVAMPLGDCIDCGACVRTCPTGIDIRDGNQMECIACVQCADACDVIMDKVGSPRGLVGYTSKNSVEGRPTQVIRPRTIVYTVICAVLAAAFIIALVTRTPLKVSVTRAADAPFMVLQDGRIANRLKFRVHNRAADGVFSLQIVEPAGAELKALGEPALTLASGEQKRLEAWVIVPPTAVPFGRGRGVFRVEGAGLSQTVDYTLLGPKGARP